MHVNVFYHKTFQANLKSETIQNSATKYKQFDFLYECPSISNFQSYEKCDTKVILHS